MMNEELGMRNVGMQRNRIALNQIETLQNKANNYRSRTSRGDLSCVQ